VQRGGGYGRLRRFDQADMCMNQLAREHVRGRPGPKQAKLRRPHVLSRTCSTVAKASVFNEPYYVGKKGGREDQVG
jgi:hypothetical protein